MGDHSGQLRQLICALTRISEAVGAVASAHEQLVTEELARELALQERSAGWPGGLGVGGGYCSRKGRRVGAGVATTAEMPSESLVSAPS